MAKAKKEQRLNRIFSECYDLKTIVDKFIYLTSDQRGRGNKTTLKHIEKCYREERLGSLLKRLDPIAFNCAD